MRSINGQENYALIMVKIAFQSRKQKATLCTPALRLVHTMSRLGSKFGWIADKNVSKRFDLPTNEMRGVLNTAVWGRPEVFQTTF